MLARLAKDNEVRFDNFGKRHLDRYVAFRSREGKSRMTLRHDGMCAKVFYAWCAKNDLLDRSPLAEYEIHNAPRPPKHMPTDDEIVALLAGVRGYWDPEPNPAIHFMPHAARIFYRDRNMAVVLGLLDTAARIGEMLSLKVGDYRAKERQIVIRESKGKEPRALPVSPEWAAQMEVWLRVRARVMRNVPKADDDGWLFISDTGAKIDEGRFLKILHRVTAFAELTDAITLHSLRRYSLNKLPAHGAGDSRGGASERGRGRVPPRSGRGRPRAARGARGRTRRRAGGERHCGGDRRQRIVVRSATRRRFWEGAGCASCRPRRAKISRGAVGEGRSRLLTCRRRTPRRPWRGQRQPVRRRWRSSSGSRGASRL